MGKRDAAILLLLYGSGLRISECLGLRAGDIPKLKSDQTGSLLIHGKGGKQRLVPALPVVLAAVAAYRRACPYPTDGALWRGPQGRRLVPRGYEQAQANLGGLYENGQGVPQDYAEARRLYLLAANRGVARAQHNLGHLYLEGIGVRRDITEAGKWFRRGADQGLAWSQYNLGLMYASGEGVPQDYVLAHQWLNLAASLFSADEKKERSKAAEDRDKVAKRMTVDQVAEAQRLAREWKPQPEQP